MVWPMGCKARLIAALEEWGISNYVEGICDDIDLFESEAGDRAASLLESEARDELPLSLFDADESTLRAVELMIRQRFRGDSIKTELVSYDDELWQQAWQANYESFQTRRFVVSVQEHPEVPAGSELLRLTSSAEAFGLGDHVTTKVILLQMEDLLGSEKMPLAPGLALLDVGTGTGILAIAAAKMGFTSIVATEIDPAAIEVARRNQQLNQVSFELLQTAEPPSGRQFDMIVVNILPPTVVNLLDKLVPLLNPKGGRIVLAGFNHANKQSVTARAQQLGLELIASRELSGWLALAFGFEI
jgi:ribosomal protein L11 methyltransferase